MLCISARFAVPFGTAKTCENQGFFNFFVDFACVFDENQHRKAWNAPESVKSCFLHRLAFAPAMGV